jgi:DNA polymerase
MLMSGDLDQMDAAAAASALAWWIESGVDAPVQEQPRDWLKPVEASAPAAKAQSAKAEPQAKVPLQLPETLDLFRDWLRDEPALPFATPTGRRVLPVGSPHAEIMLLTDTPGPEGVAEGRPLGGDPWLLAQRMLAAIGLGSEQAYCASFSCFHSAGSSLRGPELEECAAIARRHIALVQPKRLLLLGDLPAKALLGKPLAAARGHVHKVESVRTIATFHPAMMMKYPSNKELAWADLLLLMEEDS